MSNENKKQSFLEGALVDFSRYLYGCGLSAEQEKGFNKLMERYLKESFKNGLRAGYRKARQDSKPAKVGGQHAAQ